MKRAFLIATVLGATLYGTLEAGNVFGDSHTIPNGSGFYTFTNYFEFEFIPPSIDWWNAEASSVGFPASSPTFDNIFVAAIVYDKIACGAWHHLQSVSATGLNANLATARTGPLSNPGGGCIKYRNDGLYQWTDSGVTQTVSHAHQS